MLPPCVPFRCLWRLFNRRLRAACPHETAKCGPLASQALRQSAPEEPEAEPVPFHFVLLIKDEGEALEGEERAVEHTGRRKRWKANANQEDVFQEAVEHQAERVGEEQARDGGEDAV